MQEIAISRPGKRLAKIPWVPMGITSAFILVAVFANFISPHDPNMVSLTDRLKGPSWHTGFLLGTDQLGRDMLSRLFYGARVTFLVTALALFLGAGIGTVAGSIAGYVGGWVDTIIMRIADAAFAVPPIFLALLLAIMMGPSTVTVVVAITLVLWTRFARIIRGDTLSIKQRDFVAQAKIDGCSSWRILAVHIFPNLMGTLLVLVTLNTGWVIIVEATLSFLGAGVPASTPTWGAMIAGGKSYVTSAWWVSLVPGLAIALVVLSFNLFGDWLRDILDPKLSQI